MDRKGGLKLYAYCDSTWESCPMTKKRLTSHYTQMGNSLLPLFLLPWRQKEKYNFKIMGEAKYRTMGSTTSEITCILGLFKDMGVNGMEPMYLFCDNDVAIHISNNLCTIKGLFGLWN